MYKRERITEDTLAQVRVLEADGSGVVHFEAVVSEADFLNRNRRVYPESVLFPAFERLNEEISKWKAQGFKGAAGAIDHPEGHMSISDQGLAWEEFIFEGKKVIGRGFIVPTAKGRDLQAVVQAGLPAGFSTRGWADSETFEAEDGKPAKRMLALDLETVDAVSDPSVMHARITRVIKEETDKMEEELKQAQEALAAALARVAELEALVAEANTARDAVVATDAEAEAKTEALVARVAELEAVVAEAAKVTADNELTAKLNELTEGHRFAPTIIAEARELGVTIETAEKVVSRLTTLVEGVAAASNGAGAPKGDTSTEEDAEAVVEDTKPTRTEQELADLKAAGLLA